MAGAAGEVKPLMIVGLDESEHSLYTLEWTLDRFFVQYAKNPPFKLCVIHVKSPAPSTACVAGPETEEAIRHVESDMKKVAAGVTQKAKDICSSKSVTDATFEAFEGDPRMVLCDAVDKRTAAVLVVGSHGYGAIKRGILGSVSDYLCHHARCSVMIVKKPKVKS